MTSNFDDILNRVESEREATDAVQRKALARHATKKGATRLVNVSLINENAPGTRVEFSEREFTNPNG